jgi:3-phytase
MLRPAVETQPVPADADDPAIWLHPTDAARSLVVGTDKVERTGGLYVFGLDGRLRHAVTPLDRPNNVDVEYGVVLGGVATDIVVVTERLQHRLRAYRIGDGDPPLEEVSSDGGLRVLEGAHGEASEPMGVALYKRSRDGAVFAIVAPKSGGEGDYLWQYRLEDDGRRRVRARFVRRFGSFSRQGGEPGEVGEIEAVAVDDDLGFVYYSDERFGIRKYHADPDRTDAARELAVFGQEGYAADREGLAVYAGANGRGFIVSVDQVPNATRLRLYRREGAPGDPHDHREVVREVVTATDATDGLEVTSASLPGFPGGLAVLMNSAGRNFHIYRWSDLAPR